ncbi:MAG TPA: nitroreductase family deazaflavin-dependent oxidoreductase [Candidatus Dormibacteraeota bacterium]|jgi:deazaflavin-dependent oxidoreductase (nitroreductase family)|nr:nitroreductase family deazaflavin-dependent oxidoreductase [Candidatus Dormibacteraeota bacterium]
MTDAPTPQPRIGSSAAVAHAPGFVNLFNGFVSRLSRLGVPMGPNVLLTVRGRKSGRAHTTPVAVISIGGRRWIQSPYGEVNWVRNLRTAGEATLTVGDREEPVRAVPLERAESVAFFADVLGPYLSRTAINRFMAGRLGLRDTIDDPAGAATRHPVFELTPRG